MGLARWHGPRTRVHTATTPRTRSGVQHRPATETGEFLKHPPGTPHVAPCERVIRGYGSRTGERTHGGRVGDH